jgi:hypothetical protein
MRYPCSSTLRVTLAAIALLLLPRLASACACLASGPACAAVWQADAVFDGTVTTVTPLVGTREAAGRAVPVDEKRVRLTVRQAWRGETRQTMDVVTRASTADCGVDFKPGERYLVFAQRRAPDRQLFVSVCGLTSSFDGRGEVADYLGSLSAPSKGGRVFGNVRQVQRTGNATRIRTLDPSVEFKVRLSGPGPAVEVPVVAGQFEFTAVPPGRYRIDLTAPRGFVARAAARAFELVDPHACVQHDFSVASQRR